MIYETLSFKRDTFVQKDLIGILTDVNDT